MASIERTAYPRFQQPLSEQELQSRYHISEAEHDFVQEHTTDSRHRLTLLLMLKTQQLYGFVPAQTEIPKAVLDCLCDQLGLPRKTPLISDQDKKALYRHRQAIRRFLDVQPFGKEGRELARSVIERSAYTMSDPADLINVAIEELIRARYELPAFSTLDRLAGHVREQVHRGLYATITAPLSSDGRDRLDALLRVPEAEDRSDDHVFSDFARLKMTPGQATQKNMHRWAERLNWLDGLLDTGELLGGIAYTKIRQFAAEAHALDIGDLRAIRLVDKRYTMLICLVHHAQVDTRDELVEMFLKRMRRTHNRARERLRELQDKHRAIEERMLATFAEVLLGVSSQESDTELGGHIRTVVEAHGGVGHLLEQYDQVSAYHDGNHLPLLWPIHRAHRAVIYRILDQLDIRSATQDLRVVNALTYLRAYRSARRDHLPVDGTIDLSFASQRWVARVRGRGSEGGVVFKRRELELCVMSYLADGLRSGDLYVVGSQHYADYRRQLLPWSECQERLGTYCKALGMATDAKTYVQALRQELTERTNQVDAQFADGDETYFSIDAKGKPHLKRLKATPVPDGMDELQRLIRDRLPEQHLLDILKHVHYWAGYTRHFGPISGSDPKLSDAQRRYLLAVFGYGCNLGVNQTVRHARAYINRHTLRRINVQHINSAKLEAARNDIISEYTRFELPFLWGTGQVAIADGTHIELVENNLLGERHIRYGRYGGIAYHHISDTYIALFSHFIACGVWEAIYILDGLLKQQSDLRPDTVHADTHGQSESVFGLARLLGIKLMPRMRTWHDVTFYRPNRQRRYRHIDALFNDVVDWELIERHWEDMMQVVLSIQAGNVLPSMLLRKLGTHNRKNKLYQAFRELGRVERTLFLLRYLSEAEFRRGLRAEMTKIESYNDFTDWISFGGPSLKTGDPVEQEKRIKYRDVVANAVMLSNVVDLTRVLGELVEKGHPVTPEMVSRMSPYQTRHIRRFGQYVLDMEHKPDPLRPHKVKWATEATS